MKFFKKSIVIRVLLLSLFATLSLTAVMVWLGLNVQKVYLEKAGQKIRDDIQVVEKSYNDRISTTRKTLSMALEFISSNQITMAALMSSDRELLKIQYLKAFKEQLGPLYGASVLQFHTTDNHTFFRFQKPDDFGDDLSAFRKSVVQANATKQAQSGVEAGKYELAYRVVRPLFFQENHIGSVELAEDYFSILDTISTSHHTEYAVSLKNSINKLTGRAPQPADFQIGNETFLRAMGENIQTFLEQVSLNELDDKGTFHVVNNTNFIVTSHDLIDFQGNHIGHLIFLKKAESSLAEAQAVLLKGILALLIVGILLGIIYFLQMYRSIFKPIKEIVAFSSKLKHGDLSTKIAFHSPDEIGYIAKSLNILAFDLSKIMFRISSNSNEITASGKNLNSVSGSLFESTKALSERSSEIAGGNEELTMSLSEVSNKAEDGSSNINMVATAGEEMSATIAEIAENAEHTRSTMSETVEKVTHANERVKNLGTAADEISQVISVIVEIAEQTKLLALNATIEAARAGEAGRGFAVVANEVKDLATQTNAATEQIRTKIEAIQSSTHKTVEEFDSISEVISEANDMVSNIAAAVEEQAVTTRDMAENITMAAERVNEVNVTSTQSFDVASRVAREIQDLDQASNDVYANSSAIRASAEEINTLGAELQESVSQFKLSSEAIESFGTQDKESLIKWDPKYSVEVEIIDTQHQKLIAIINQLHDAMKNKRSGTFVGSIFKDLIDYTVFHFDEEQKLMEKAGYSELPKHIEVHKALVEQVAKYQREYADGRNLSHELMEFLKNWLINHIMVQDKKYIPFMKAKGIK